MGTVVILVLLVASGGLLAWVVRAVGWRFAARRFGQALLILVLVTFGTTWILTQFSGDPCVSALGIGASEEAVQQCTEDRKLDESVFVQYGAWVGSVLSGDLGLAKYKSGIPLTDILRARGPRTLLLFAYSQGIALAVAVPLGIWSAYQAGRPPRKIPRWALPVAIVALGGFGLVVSWSLVLLVMFGLLLPVYVYNGFRGGAGADRLVNTTAFVFLSIPVFVLGETLRYWFAINWDWYDLIGYVPISEGLFSHLKSIWLPALVLGLAVAPIYLRLLRADMMQNLQQDFVAVAKAKGMSNTHILLRHVLRPSTLTLLTVAGLNIAQLVNGAIVIEFIYDLDGLGSYLIEALAAREFFPVQTLVAMVAVIFVLTNTIIDLLYTAVDPRVSAEDGR